MSVADGIAREDGPTGGRYVFRRDGLEAELTYSRMGETRLIADYTGVPDAFQGQGVGLALVERLVADARADNLRIVALCPFVKAQARRHPEWSDVIE
ncbi:MAG: GNAT family N-acetyltransferase [Pseudomonadota bacterium]